MLFPPFQRFVADVVSVMLFFQNVCRRLSRRRVSRGREVVCEADDGQDASAVGDELSASLSFVPAW